MCVFYSFCFNFFPIAVVGCADLNPPERVIVKRYGNEATISCRHGNAVTAQSSQQRKWNATCRDDQWIGPNGGVLTSIDFDNCTAPPPLLTNGNVKGSFR